MIVSHYFNFRHCTTKNYNILKTVLPFVAHHMPYYEHHTMINTDIKNIMLPEWVRVPLPKSRDNMVPRTPDVCAVTEILDHSSLSDVQDCRNPEP